MPGVCVIGLEARRGNTGRKEGFLSILVQAPVFTTGEAEGMDEPLTWESRSSKRAG